MKIVHAESAEQLEQVKELFREYWTSFGFSPCFQNFETEVAGLPGAYAPPGGALALALVGDRPAGCAALRPFQAHTAEFKRLFVHPDFRGHGVGRALLMWVVAEARRLGYTELVGDTIPQMTVALDMYDRAGFQRTAPYSEIPTPGAIYLRLKL